MISCDQCDWSVDDARPGREAQRLSLHRQHKHGVAKGTPAPVSEERSDAVDTGADADGPFGGAPVTDEIPPAPGGIRSAGPEPSERRGFFASFKRKARTEDGGPAPAKSPEKAPKPPRGYAGKRLSAAKDIGDLVGWAGGGLQRIGHVPTGRMVRFQAPITGELVDDLVKGTRFDKTVVQRLVATRAKIDVLAAVFGPTVLVWQMEKAVASGSQAQVDMIGGLLRASIRDSLPVLLPAARRVRAREAKTNAEMAELLEEEDLAALGVEMRNGKPVEIATGKPVDVADVFVAMLFAEWTPPEPSTLIDVEVQEQTT